MESQSDNLKLRAPSSPSISSISSINTDSECETWTVIGNKEGKIKDQNFIENEAKKSESLKITNDKHVDVDDEIHNDGNNKENICSESILSHHKMDDNISRIQEIDKGHEADEDASDGVSVISDADTDNHEHQTEFNERLRQRINVLPSSNLSEKKVDSLSKMVVLSQRPQSLTVKLNDFMSDNRGIVIVVMICVIGTLLAGVFCQIGMMLGSQRIDSGSNINFMLYEQKLENLKLENQNLKEQILGLKDQLEKISQDSSGKKPIPSQNVPFDRKKAMKEVKTKYDKFDRPPVAAGGEEDSFVHVTIVNEEEEVDEGQDWTSSIDPLFEPFQNFWSDNGDVQTAEENQVKVDESVDAPKLNENESVQCSHNQGHCSPSVNAEKPNHATVESKKEFSHPNHKNQNGQKEKQTKFRNEDKKQKFDEQNKAQKHEKENESSGDFKQNKKNQKSEFNNNKKREYSQEKNSREDRKNYKDEKFKRSDSKSEDSDERVDFEKKGSKKFKDHDKSFERKGSAERTNRKSENSDEKIDFEKKGSKKFKDHDKSFERKGSAERTNRKSENSNEKIDFEKKESKKYNKNQDKKFKHKDSAEQSNRYSENSDERIGFEKKEPKKYKDQDKSFERENSAEYKKKKENKKQEYETKHDYDRQKSKNENKYKDNKKQYEKEKGEKDNWYIERQSSREASRAEQDHDSNWFMERQLERELLRSREPDLEHERN